MEGSPFDWLIVLSILALLIGGRKIPELMRELGEGINNMKGPRGGPSHPLQVTGPIETSKRKRSDQDDNTPQPVVGYFDRP